MNIGDRIGDYEIVQVLGGGGTGQAYKVRKVLSGGIAAMKVLLREPDTDPGLAERLLNEINVQATLDHPNIVKVQPAMRTANQVVMIREFVEGTSLSQLLQGGPVRPSTAAAFAVELLNALSYAHAHGVIHGDIKATNIVLTSGGEIKLMDFGIVPALTGLSRFYISPEQVAGGHPDARSDLYSLGITIHEIITGKPGPVVEMDVIRGIPSGLSEIILMAIEKNPAARFQCADAFRAALLSVFPAPAVPAASTAPVAVPVTIAPPPVIAPPPFPRAEPASVAAAPWLIQRAPARSRRGLYMALGSAVTLAVLVGAVIEAPKLMRGAAAEAKGVRASTASPASRALVETPSPTANAAPVAAAGIPPISAPVSMPAMAAPVQAPHFKQQPVPAQYAFRPAQAPPVQNAESAPVAVRVAPAASPSSGAPPVTAATASPELKELRDRVNRVAIRAAAAQAGVRSIEQGVQAQGLSLRGDIKAASIRLDYVLQEARASLQNGDVEGARNNLQYAEGSLQKIDKFLGQ